MAANPDNLLWVDMEMSGLNPDTDRVLEVAIVITDSQLNTVAEAPVFVVHQSDAVLDAILAQDKRGRVACETLVKTGVVIVAGEVTTDAVIDVEGLVRRTVLDIGYNSSEMGFDGASCGVLNIIGKQSPDIAQGVDRKDPRKTILKPKNNLECAVGTLANQIRRDNKIFLEKRAYWSVIKIKNKHNKINDIKARVASLAICYIRE